MRETGIFSVVLPAKLNSQHTKRAQTDAHLPYNFYLKALFHGG